MGSLGDLKHVSPSSLGTFVRCSEQWRRRYINREVIPPGIAMHRGKGVHKAVELNNRQKRDSWEDLPLDILQDAARDGVINNVRKESLLIPPGEARGFQDIVASGVDAAVRLTKVYRECVAPSIQPVLVEEKVTMDIGLEVPLLGYLDCFTAAGVVNDTKTSGKSKTQAEIDTSSQLTAYAGMTQNRMGVWPLVQLDVLVDTKAGKHQRLNSIRGPRDFEIMVSRISLMLQQIKTGLFPPCDPGSWACSPKWCGYYPTCRYAMGAG